MLQDLLSETYHAFEKQWSWSWVQLVAFVILWRITIWSRIYLKRPNVFIGGAPLIFGMCISTIQFITGAPGMIQEIYNKIGQRPFAIPALSEYQVLVSSEQHMEELSHIPERILSFHQAMDDRLKHKYTMYGFEHNDVDPHNSIPSRVLKVLLRMSLPDIQCGLQPLIEDCVARELKKNDMIEGWTKVPAFSLARMIFSAINNRVLFGEELGNNHEFNAASMEYSHDVVVAMEICRHIPSFLVPIVARTVMRWRGSVNKIASFVTPLVERRLQMENYAPNHHDKPEDFVQWVIDSSHTNSQRTVTRLVQQLIALLFASAHQLPMNLVYALYSLCLHPQYLEPLREEVSHANRKDLKTRFDDMPLMDSFLRESARLNPLDALSVQRKALVTFTFSDGTNIPAGNLIAVPQHALMRDSRHYTDPDQFNGFRFVYTEDGVTKSRPKFTDVNLKYPYWGSPRKACPGRWYVSRTSKQILAHLITNYDIQLADERAPRTFIWTTAIVPRFDTILMVRKREPRVP